MRASMALLLRAESDHGSDRVKLTMVMSLTRSNNSAGIRKRPTRPCGKVCILAVDNPLSLPRPGRATCFSDAHALLSHKSVGNGWHFPQFLRQFFEYYRTSFVAAMSLVLYVDVVCPAAFRQPDMVLFCTFRTWVLIG